MQLYSLDANDPGALGAQSDPVDQRPNNAALWRVIEDHIRARMRAAGYRERKPGCRSPATIQPLRSLQHLAARVSCPEDRIEAEIARSCRIKAALLGDFGFEPIEARAVQGGDIEFHIPDRPGRAWQSGGIRVVRGGGRAVLHHAVLGSPERFIDVLLEHHDGNLPAWLAPEQVLVASINKEAAAYALKIEQALIDAGLRVALDDGPDTLPRKIVDARERGIPMIAVIGKREARERTVTLRHRDGRQEVLELDRVAAHIAAVAAVPRR